MDTKTLGQRALARRKELRLTQREVARLAGVAHVTISQWERDETQPVGKRLFALADALKCSPTWLMFGDEDKTPLPAQELHVENELTPSHKELIELFDALPSSEQEALLSEMRARVENFNRLFEEMLKARKNKSIK
ncbi:helix-turn-helix domain-containing protein [Escherichia coli]|uniref:Helix-turn-helix domain-containing protein n=1 Tax=Escherichia coli TaxID=562 RepID=A0A3Y8HY16_ECOLX|nr:MULTISPECIES: helix-turn-helix domain-containing protein [Escherichia]EFA4284800.1 helix-turn-helix domain-containing protein [Escherichia coli O36]ELP2957257.1 helix-turn-helix domain-containing protein [Escherichia coli O168]QGT53764.1 prophage repressor [Escherichia phage Rac]EAB8243865.1 helix-turn-helix domain-containing protein [Escherichia coli]EEQ4408468.1 helix-turn-helix domain-containing protein [Escherichia coli]